MINKSSRKSRSGKSGSIKSNLGKSGLRKHFYENRRELNDCDIEGCKDETENINTFPDACDNEMVVTTENNSCSSGLIKRYSLSRDKLKESIIVSEIIGAPKCKKRHFR